MKLLTILSSRRSLMILNSQTRFFSSVVPAPTTLPPSTKSTLVQATESSQRRLMAQLAPHLTPSVHHLLHPLILTAANNPTSILDELARVRERLNIDTTGVFDDLIRVYFDIKKPDLALECFNLMKEKGVLPNIETCNQMLMLFLTLNRTKAGEFITNMETLGAETAIYNYNTVIHHGDGGKFEAACLRFQAMKDSGLSPSAYSTNSYIFVMWKEGRIEEASDLVPQMLESDSGGLVPHPVAYDALIHECCKTWNLDYVEKGIAYKDEMISKGIQPTLVTYTLLIDMLFELGDSETGEDLIKEMQEKGLELDAYTYNTLMNGYYKRKQVGVHKWLYPQMVEKSIQPTLLTYNTRMLGYCKCNEVEEARKLLQEMNTRGIKPDHISYNILIAGYSSIPDVKEAFRVRDEMLKNGVDPTITTYYALIQGLGHNNEVGLAEELLKEMVSEGICTPDDTTYLGLTEIVKGNYKVLIKRLCKNNEVERAEELLKEMVSKGICTLDDTTYQIQEDPETA